MPPPNRSSNPTATPAARARPICLLLAAAALAVAHPHATHAGPADATHAVAGVDIRYAIPDGLVFDIDNTSTMDLSIDIAAGGQTATVDQRSTQRMQGRAVVLDTADGRPTRVSLSLSPGCGTESVLMGNRESTPFDLAGQRVIVRLDGERLADVEGGPAQLDPTTWSALTELVAMPADFLPGRTLSIGDEWTTTLRSPDARTVTEATFRLEDTLVRHGRTVARLSCRGEVHSGDDASGRLAGTIVGSVLVDLDTGLHISSHLAGPITSSATSWANGTRTTLSGRGFVDQYASKTADWGQDQHPDPATTTDDTGTWQGDGISLELAGDRLTLSRDGQDLQASVQSRTDAAFRGKVTADGDAQPFEAAVLGEVGVVSLAGRTSFLRRTTTSGVRTGTDPTAAERNRTPDDWTRYERMGFSFRHPPGWTMSEAGDRLLIMPPDMDAQSEAILGYATAAPAGVRVGPEQVAGELDAMIRGFAPTLRRTAPPAPMPSPAGDGWRCSYRGMSPDGRAVRCEVFILVGSAHIASLSVLGTEDRVERRTPVVAQIFATLAMPAGGQNAAPGAGPGPAGGAGGSDLRLVGMFAGESIAGGPGSVYVNTRIVYAFNADGTMLNGAQSAMNASQRDFNGEMVWTFNADTGADIDRGRWSASGGRLTIRWDSGTVSTFAYGFEPDGSLVLRHPQTRRLINFYPRVR